MEFELGRTYAGYKFLDVVRRSRSVVQYRVQNTIAQRQESLQTLPAAATDDQDASERFLREVRVRAHLTHPHVISFYTAMPVEGRMVMTTELYDGLPLAERLQLGPLPWRVALRVASQILDGLTCLHQQSFVHCDITPENILFGPEGFCKLSSFAWARPIRAAHAPESGSVAGNPTYISPEQVKGVRELDPRSDLYSVGVVLYEMLCGRPPFESRSQFELMLAHVNQAPTPPSEVNAAVPGFLDALVLRGLAKEPADRYQSAQDFLAALEAADAAPEAEAVAEAVTVLEAIAVVEGGAMDAVVQPVAAPEMKTVAAEPVVEVAVAAEVELVVVAETTAELAEQFVEVVVAPEAEPVAVTETAMPLVEEEAAQSEPRPSGNDIPAPGVEALILAETVEPVAEILSAPEAEVTEQAVELVAAPEAEPVAVTETAMPVVEEEASQSEPRPSGSDIPAPGVASLMLAETVGPAAEIFSAPEAEVTEEAVEVVAVLEVEPIMVAESSEPVIDAVASLEVQPVAAVEAAEPVVEAVAALEVQPVAAVESTEPVVEDVAALEVQPVAAVEGAEPVVETVAASEVEPVAAVEAAEPFIEAVAVLPVEPVAAVEAVEPVLEVVAALEVEPVAVAAEPVVELVAALEAEPVAAVEAAEPIVAVAALELDPIAGPEAPELVVEVVAAVEVETVAVAAEPFIEEVAALEAEPVTVAVEPVVEEVAALEVEPVAVAQAAEPVVELLAASQVAPVTVAVVVEPVTAAEPAIEPAAVAVAVKPVAAAEPAAEPVAVAQAAEPVAADEPAIEPAAVAVEPVGAAAPTPVPPDAPQPKLQAASAAAGGSLQGKLWSAASMVAASASAPAAFVPQSQVTVQPARPSLPPPAAIAVATPSVAPVPAPAPATHPASAPGFMANIRKVPDSLQWFFFGGTAAFLGVVWVAIWLSAGK